MSGCQTCGGYGMHHDPTAHGQVAETDAVIARIEALVADMEQVVEEGEASGDYYESATKRLRDALSQP